jgi:hypothetical protein
LAQRGAASGGRDQAQREVLIWTSHYQAVDEMDAALLVQRVAADGAMLQHRGDQPLQVMLCLPRPTSFVPGTMRSRTCRAQVLDGDTIMVDGIHVRLPGVAAPEIGHPSQPQDEPRGPSCAS